MNYFIYKEKNPFYILDSRSNPHFLPNWTLQTRCTGHMILLAGFSQWLYSFSFMFILNVYLDRIFEKS
jgi:hypothetical protein